MGALQRQPGRDSVEDYSVLLPLFERMLFMPAARLLPVQLRPNAITVAGQCCAVLATLAAVGAVSGKRSLYLVSAALHFGFLMADNLDGLHARLTGQVSRVGELLDHGLDGIAGISALLTVGVIMRVDGIWLVGLAYVGTMAFVAAYWEQYRTGLLVCPAIGQLEGFTAIAGMEVVLFAFHDPPALRFSHGSLTAGTLLVAGTLLGYLGAAFGSVFRAARLQVRPGGLLVVGLAGLLPFGYVLAGANPWLPAIIVGLFGADVVVRSVRMLKGGRRGSLAGWSHLGFALPLLGVMLPGQPWSATAWTGVAASLAAMVYAATVVGGVRELRGSG